MVFFIEIKKKTLKRYNLKLINKKHMFIKIKHTKYLYVDEKIQI